MIPQGDAQGLKTREPNAEDITQSLKSPESHTVVECTQTASNRDVVGFLDLLRKLVDNPSTIWLDQVLKENERMRAILREKNTDSDALGRVIAKLQGDLDTETARSADFISQREKDRIKTGELTAQVQAARRTIAEKDEQLKEGARQITELKGNLERLGRELKVRDDTIRAHEKRLAIDTSRLRNLEGTLGTTKVELDIKAGELKELQSLSCNVVDGSKEFVSGELDKIYSYAKIMAMKYFGDDLPEDILSNTRLVEGISGLIKPIPFPPSNSVAAKKARVAAFLACLGSRLADRVFLPFYSTQIDSQDSDGIDSIACMLSDLSVTDPRRELHLRSVLLAIAPTDQKEAAHARGQDIANDIYSTLGILLSADQRPLFHSDIKKLCQLAVDTWDGLRCIREKVEPFTETNEQTEKYWLPAELDGGLQSAAKKLANGTYATNGLAAKPSVHSLKSANKVILVWPGFSYDSDVLKQGFMLLDTQVKIADEEARPQRRNIRAMQRASSTSKIPLQTHRLSTVRNSKLFATRAGGAD